MQGRLSIYRKTLPPHHLVSDPSPTFWKESFTCIKEAALFIPPRFLPLPKFLTLPPRIAKPHEIYTTFKLNVNEGYVSFGFHGMMVKIPQ